MTPAGSASARAGSRPSATGLAGTPNEVVDRLGNWRERTGVSRVYLETLDLHDLDHVELVVAAEVVPRL